MCTAPILSIVYSCRSFWALLSRPSNISSVLEFFRTVLYSNYPKPPLFYTAKKTIKFNTTWVHCLQKKLTLYRLLLVAHNKCISSLNGPSRKNQPQMYLFKNWWKTTFPLTSNWLRIFEFVTREDSLLSFWLCSLFPSLLSMKTE